MICPNKSFDDSRALRVLVVPIGENSAFEQHFNIISKLKCIPMYDLVKPSGWGKTGSAGSSNSTVSPYRHFNWSSGSLLFEYLRYDRVPYGSAGDLGNFQTSRRVSMIMGLINYMEVVPAGTSNEEGNVLIEQEIEDFLRKYPKVTTRRIFVFNYTFHLNSVPPVCRLSADDPLALTIFPPDGGMCGEDESLTSMVDVHLREVMSNAAVIIITSIEAQLMQCDAVRTTKSQFWSNSMGGGNVNSGSPAVITSIHGSSTNPNAIKLFTLYDDSFNDVNVTFTGGAVASVSPMGPASSNGSMRRASISSTVSSLTVGSVAGAGVASESTSSPRYGPPSAPLSFTYTGGAYNAKAGGAGSSASRSDSTLSSSMAAMGRDRDLNSNSMKDVISSGSGAGGSGTASKRVSEVGRVRKRMGDLCLQMCSPMDSLEHYAAAMAECRSAGDYLWLAGAQEGFASAIYVCFQLDLPFQDMLTKDIRAPLAALVNQQALQTQEQEFRPLDTYDNPPSASAYDAPGGWLSGSACPPLETTAASLVALSAAQLQDLALWNLAEEKAQEAINLYSKCIVLCGLEVECCLKLARLHALAGSVEKERRVLDCVMRAVSVQGLNAQQQIECVLEGAFICKKLGNMSRKYALLLYLASLMSAEDDNPQLALELIAHAGDGYGLGFHHRGNGSSGQCVSEGSGSIDSDSADDACMLQWGYIRKTLLLHAAHFATESENHSAAVKYLSGAVCAVSEIAAQLVAQKSNFVFNSTLLTSSTVKDADRVLLWYWGSFFPDEPQSAVRIRSFLYHLQFEHYQLLELQRKCLQAGTTSGAVDSVVPTAIESFLAATEVPALLASRMGTESAQGGGELGSGAMNANGVDGAFDRYVSMLRDNKLINDRMAAQVSSLYGAATGASVSDVSSLVGGFTTPLARRPSDASGSIVAASVRSAYSVTPQPGQAQTGTSLVSESSKGVTPVKTLAAAASSFVGPNPMSLTDNFERVKNSSVVVIEKKPEAPSREQRQSSITGLHIRHRTKSLLYSVRARLRQRMSGTSTRGRTEDEELADILTARFGGDLKVGVINQRAASADGSGNRLDSLESQFAGDASFCVADPKSALWVEGGTATGTLVQSSEVGVQMPFYEYLPGNVSGREQQYILSLLHKALPKVSPYLQIKLPAGVLVSMQMRRRRCVHLRPRIQRHRGIAIVKPEQITGYVEKLAGGGDDTADTTAPAASGGSLFFDPFAFMSKKKIASAAEEVVWVLSKGPCSLGSRSSPDRCGFGSVSVVLSNPLSVPLLLERVTLLLKCHLDVEYETYPHSYIVIPPLTQRHVVEFTVRYFESQACREGARGGEVSFLEAVGIEVAFGASIARLCIKKSSANAKADSQEDAIACKDTPCGGRAPSTENVLVAVIATAIDYISLITDYDIIAGKGRHCFRSAFKGNVFTSLRPVDGTSSRPGNSSGGGCPPAAGQTPQAVGAENSPVKKKLQVKFGRSASKLADPERGSGIAEALETSRNGDDSLQLHPGERYSTSAVLTNNSQLGLHSFDITDYQITVYECGEEADGSCLRSYIIKPFERCTLANNVPTVEKDAPQHPLVSLISAVHLPQQPIPADAAEPACPSVCAEDKLRLNFQFQMLDGGCFETIRRVDIEITFAVSQACSDSSQAVPIGEYMHRLHWSQPVQCSGGVVITALQHISPPWQLTAHQQQQVVSVLQPGERGAAKSDGGGNASHSCGPEDVCLVGLDIAASALDHFCLENAAFAEINSEACVCANSPCRVAMSETEPMQHFVAVKLENKTNFDVSISTAASLLFTGELVRGGNINDIFVPSPETDYSYAHLLAPKSTRTIMCKRPVAQDTDAAVTSTGKTDAGVLLPLHAVVHEAERDKYTTISCCASSAVNVVPVTTAPDTEASDAGIQNCARRMRPISRPPYRVRVSLSDAGPDGKKLSRDGANAVRCRVRQKYKVSMSATRHSLGLELGSGAEAPSESAVEIAIVALSVADDAHRMTAAAVMTGTGAGTGAGTGYTAPGECGRAWGSDHVLVSGKSKCICQLSSSRPDSATGCSACHTINIVFTRPGAYKIVCLVRDPGDIATGNECGPWYTVPNPLLVSV